MDFRQLLEGNCGQVNPIAQLATHVTQDHARQGNIGKPFVTNQIVQEENAHGNVMLPSTFNMNKLMDELQIFDSPRSSAKQHHSFGDLWATQDNHQLTQNSVQTSSKTETYGNFFPMEGHTMNSLPQHLNFPFNQLPSAHFPSDALNLSPLFQVGIPIYSQSDAEELSARKLQREIAESQKIFNDLEEDEENLGIPETEDKISKPPAYLEYGGLFEEDVYGISDLKKNFSKVEHFYNFVENYVLKDSIRKYHKYLPNQPTIPEMATQYECDQSLFGCFSECLEIKGQHCDLIKFARKIKNIPKESVFSLTDAYLHEHCFYQACQTLFNWLKNDPRYKDIIPPNFTMEDRTETTIDQEQHRALTKMFIKAAQRYPHDPDVGVQIGLAKLCEIDQDYEKSVDCYRSILEKTKLHYFHFYVRVCLGNNLALANKSEEAIEILHEAMRSRSKINRRAYTNIGLIYLYNGYYRPAITYLFNALGTKGRRNYGSPEDTLLEKSWSCLRLCFDLLGRDDLCELVDIRDHKKIMEIISTFLA